MPSRFAVGDLVRVRPDGPEMIVEAVYAPIFVYRYLCRPVGPDAPPAETYPDAQLTPSPPSPDAQPG